MCELTPETSLGFECIRFAEDVLDLHLMPWQKWFLVHALELHPTDVGGDGFPLYRFRKVVLLVGRQNGKSTVMQALTLWRMFVDRCSLVIGTAQDLEIAESLLRESYEMAEDVDDLASELEPLKRGSGKMSFRLRSGESYKVKASTRRGGRGLSGELVLLDELREHQSWDAWGAVTKTTNAKERAQIYGISNAGDAASIVLRHLRRRAHDRVGDPDGLNADATILDDVPDLDDVEELDLDDDTLGLFEWSAPPGCRIRDREGWAQANPALGHRIREATLASDAANDPEWIFRTEVLCQWSEGTLEGPFPPGVWDRGHTEDRLSLAAESVLCVDVSWDRSMAYVGLAQWRDDGVPQVEIVAASTGTAWVADWLTSDDRPAAVSAAPVVVQSTGAPASSLIVPLQAAGVEVVEWKGTDVPKATGDFYDRVRRGEDGVPGVRHRTQPALNLAAATAIPRHTADGAFMWDRKHSPNDVAPLVAATGALWCLTSAMPSEPTKSVYETRGVLSV